METREVLRSWLAAELMAQWTRPRPHEVEMNGNRFTVTLDSEPTGMCNAHVVRTIRHLARKAGITGGAE